MMDVLDRYRAMSNITELFSLVSNMADSLPDIWNLFASAKGANDVDLQFLDYVIGDAQRMIDKNANNIATNRRSLDTVKELAYYGQRVLNWLRFSLNDGNSKYE